MQNESPWSGLQPAGVDTRRVSAAARWNWFWAVLPGPDPALVLRIADAPQNLSQFPPLRHLDVHVERMPDGAFLCLRLRDRTQIGPFEALCRDVVAAGEMAATERAALETAVGRALRWHRLLQGGASGLLSEEEQRGLIGEIEILKLLIGAIGAKAALEGWTGPSGAPKDFELDRGCIEVKARREAAQPFVSISNEFQLSDVPDRRLWLAVLAVDWTQAPNGDTLASAVAAVTDLLDRIAPSLVSVWQVRVAEAGFDPHHDYAPWRWKASAPVFHAVEPGFPRIPSPLPPGVWGVTHRLALSACEPFLVDWDAVQALLSGSPPDE